jgi:hypothetical protein
LKIKGAYKMRKTISGVVAAIGMVGFCAIPGIYDAEYVTFGQAIFLTLVFGLIVCIGLYGAEAFIFQQGSNDKRGDYY